MKRILPYVVALLLIGLPCARGQQIVETDPLPAFSGLSLSGPLKVELIPSQENRMSITLWDIDSRHIEWHVKENVLNVSARKGVINKQGYVEIKLYYISLSRITGKGAEIIATRPLVTPSLYLEAESSRGVMELAVDVEDITVHTSGSNTVRLSGTADAAVYRARLGSRIESLNLEADHVIALASGKAEIHLCSQELLEATAQTGGNIFYTGDPSNLSVKKGLAGGVEQVSAR